MLISGIQKFTLLDFPENIACIVFLAGCDFRCGYCHNPEFVLPEEIKKLSKSFIPEDAFFNFLDSRKTLLDGVVISGGEPTIVPSLPMFIKKIKDFGFKVKLDTNGNNPIMLENLLKENLIDYIAMDVKTSLEEYPALVGPRIRPDSISKSVKLIKKSEINYEFRSTLIREIHPKEILENMAAILEGSSTYYVQTFRNGHTLDKKFKDYHAFTETEMNEIAKRIFAKKVKNVSVR